MKALPPLAFAAALALAPLAQFSLAQPALAQPGPPRANPGAALPTPDFLRVAAQSDAYERAAGRLAAQKGGDRRVRAFGQMMAREHARTTAALQRAIRRAGLRVAAPPPLRPEQRGMLADLRERQGAPFDRVYLDQQVNAHRDALMVMSDYAQGGSNPVLREAAASTAPLVRRHLDAATALRERIGR